ncbi:type II toxin-antitoxin system VapC family toxin [bacterium]|nr:MAG: type II toxin-antitoxin system VapC family toxin [bacterium]
MLLEGDEFLTVHELLPVGEAEARQYAKIRAELEARGERIGPNDLLIAATAMVVEAALVTHNVRSSHEFRALCWTTGTSRCANAVRRATSRNG